MTACRWCGGDTTQPGHDHTWRHQIWLFIRADPVPVMNTSRDETNNAVVIQRGADAPKIAQRGAQTGGRGI